MRDRKTITVVHVCEALAGGVARHLEVLIPALVPHVQQSLICCTVRADCVGRAAIRRCEELGIEVICRSDPMRWIGTVFGAAKRPKGSGRVVFHAHSTLAGVAARVVARRCDDIPVVYTPHGFATLHVWRPTWMRRMVSLIERTLRTNTAALVVLSKQEEHEALRLGYRAHQVVRMRNPIPSFRHARRHGLRSCRGATFGYLGRLSPQKGLETLLSAWELVYATRPAGRLLIAGDGPLRPRLDAWLRSHPDSRVTYLGWKEAGEFFSKIDWLIIPSLFEAMPYVVLEAIGHGVPVIGSRCGAIPELVEQFGCGLTVDVGDRTGLAEIIMKIIDQPDIITLPCARAEAAATTYAPEVVAQEMVDLYLRILNAKEGDCDGLSEMEVW